MSKRRGYRGIGDDGYNNPTATEAINNVSRGDRRRERENRAAVERHAMPGDLRGSRPGAWRPLDEQ